MNVYTTKFFSNCPNNGIRIEYTLVISNEEVVPVEQIVAKVESLSEGFHEELADELKAAFGGSQVLTAWHHSVLIETTRS